MREKVQDKISHLCDIVQQFDTEKQVPNLSTLFANVLENVAQKHTKLQGSLLSSTDKLVWCHFPQCFVCKREFVGKCVTNIVITHSEFDEKFVNSIR